MKQIYLTMSRTWQDVLDECIRFYVAKDVDGVMVYVIRDGQEQIREKG